VPFRQTRFMMPTLRFLPVHVQENRLSCGLALGWIWRARSMAFWVEPHGLNARPGAGFTWWDRTTAKLKELAKTSVLVNTLRKVRNTDISRVSALP